MPIRANKFLFSTGRRFMKTLTIQLIRHGQTIANETGRYVGITDEPLSVQGVNKLKSIALSHKYPKATVYYVSPLKRCIQTLNILYSEATPVVINNLTECNLGKFENKTQQELKDDKDFSSWMFGEKNLKIPGVESGMEFSCRVVDCFDKLVISMFKSSINSAVLITHSSVLTTILANFGIPKASAQNWATDFGYGYSIRTNIGLYMRNKAFEVYSKIPM
jgi:alpha-ribazole phosphatase